LQLSSVVHELHFFRFTSDPGNCPDISTKGWKIAVLLVLLIPIALMITLAMHRYWKRKFGQEQIQILQNDQHELVSYDNYFAEEGRDNILDDIELQEQTFNVTTTSMSSV
ncbi:unnamed protein product, partial [Allacma fusca]